jgi:hypothetical protein
MGQAGKFGFKEIDPKDKKPGDRVFAVNDDGSGIHSTYYAGKDDKGNDLYLSDHGSGQDYKKDYAFWPPGSKRKQAPQRVFTYIGNVPQYEDELEQARKKITPSSLPMKSASLYVPQEPELQYTNQTNNNTMSKSKKGGSVEAFPQQPTGDQLFKMSFIPQGPVGFYKQGGPLNTNMIAFPQQPPANVFFSNGIPWQPHYGMGGAPCYNCGGPKMNYGGGHHTMPDGRVMPGEEHGDYDDQFGDNVDGNMDYFKSGGNWIQKATKGMRTDKPCTGSKFGGPTCPPGSKRYNLAKTFRAMAKKEEGGPIKATTQQDYLDQYNGNVKTAINKNMQPFIKKDVANTIMGMDNEVQNIMQPQYAAMGMEAGMMNPETMQRMQMYQDQMNQLNSSSQEAFGNAFGAGMNMINTANPYMDYTADQMSIGGIPRAENGYNVAQKRLIDKLSKDDSNLFAPSKENANAIAGFRNNPQQQGPQGYRDPYSGWDGTGSMPWITSSNAPGSKQGAQQMNPQQQAQLAALQQMQGQGQGHWPGVAGAGYNNQTENRYTAPNQQAYYNQGMQGNQYIPYNSNPHMNWRTQGMPNVGFNPQNTYLESFEAKKRLFGPGARKVKMTFRTYRDPMTGQVTQQPGQQPGQQRSQQSTDEDELNFSKYTPEERQIAEGSQRPYQPEVHDEAVDKRREMNWFQRRRDDKNVKRLQKKDEALNKRVKERAAEHGPIEPYGASPFSAGFPASYNLPVPTNQQQYDNSGPSSSGLNLKPMPQIGNPGWREPGYRYGGGRFYNNGGGIPGMPQMGPTMTPNMYRQFYPGGEPYAYDQPEGEFQDWSVTGRRRLGLDHTASAEGILYGLGIPSAFDKAAQAERMKEKMAENSAADVVMQGEAANRIGSKGRWMEGTGVMDPNNMQVIQQPGNIYAGESQTSFTKFGGPKYNMGGEQYLTEDEITQVLANGGSVEYLD